MGFMVENSLLVNVFFALKLGFSHWDNPHWCLYVLDLITFISFVAIKINEYL